MQHVFLFLNLGGIEILLLLLPIILMIYTLQDVIRSNVSNKAIWIVFIVLAPVIGSFAYLLAGKNNLR